MFSKVGKLSILFLNPDGTLKTSGLFIYSWFHWIFATTHRLSLDVESRGFSSSRCMSFLLWPLLLRSRAPGTRAEELRLTGLIAQQHVDSSWTSNQTRVPCISRHILKHWTTREVLWNEQLILLFRNQILNIIYHDF